MAGGVALAVQGKLNSELGLALGDRIGAALASFATGLAAVLLFALVALVAFFFLRSRYRPPARQESGPVESGTPSTRVP
jgi:transporter family-2 protein